MDNTKFITPYKAAQIVNQKLGTNVRVQMMYNYAKQHYLGAIKNSEGKFRINIDDLNVWIEKYAAKKGLKIQN